MFHSLLQVYLTGGHADLGYHKVKLLPHLGGLLQKLDVYRWHHASDERRQNLRAEGAQLVQGGRQGHGRGNGGLGRRRYSEEEAILTIGLLTHCEKFTVSLILLGQLM